jgi:hypothetical protein
MPSSCHHPPATSHQTTNRSTGLRTAAFLELNAATVMELIAPA